MVVLITNESFLQHYFKFLYFVNKEYSTRSVDFRSPLTISKVKIKYYELLKEIFSVFLNQLLFSYRKLRNRIRNELLSDIHKT